MPTRNLQPAPSLVHRSQLMYSTSLQESNYSTFLDTSHLHRTYLGVMVSFLGFGSS